jgi:hypothetical protein
VRRPRYPSPMADRGYLVTVTAEGRKTPVLEYKGAVPTVSGLDVLRDEDVVRLVYRDDPGAAHLVLAEAPDPGGALELNRQDLDGDGNPKGHALTRAVEQ